MWTSQKTIIVPRSERATSFGAAPFWWKAPITAAAMIEP